MNSYLTKGHLISEKVFFCRQILQKTNEKLKVVESKKLKHFIKLKLPLNTK